VDYYYHWLILLLLDYYYHWADSSAGGLLLSLS
jgi:hypothetical protein